MADVLWRWNTTVPPAAPVYATATADEASPPDPDAVIIEDTRVAFDRVTANEVNVDPSGDLIAGAISMDQDTEITTQGAGHILKDKTTGARFRVLMDNGVLTSEAL